MIGLNSAKGFLQFKIGSGIQMRNTPRIVFELDSSLESGAEMIGKLDQLERNREETISDNIDEDDDNQ